MNILQMSVPSEMRGRVMGIYMLSFLGGTPLGSPLLGWLADSVDPRAPLIVGGVISLVSGTVAGGCTCYAAKAETSSCATGRRWQAAGFRPASGDRMRRDRTGSRG